MTEGEPPLEPPFGDRERAVEVAIASIGEGIQLGTIKVSYDSPDWAYGDVWVKAVCEECGANSVMRASNLTACRYLAHVIALYRCPENGHQNSLVERDGE